MELLTVLSIHCNMDFQDFQVPGVISPSDKVGFFQAVFSSFSTFNLYQP